VNGESEKDAHNHQRKASRIPDDSEGKELELELELELLFNYLSRFDKSGTLTRDHEIGGWAF
jgi:hypothetical protein